MAGYVGNIPVPQGTQTRQTFTATASQTSFPTIGYTAGFIDVYLNGVKLLDTVDYAATNGSDVVLTTGAALNDILEVTIFDTFTTAGTSFTNPTFIDTATVSGDTTATVTLKNNTEEDTDGGRESTIIFSGEQSGGEISTLAEIEAAHDGTADDQKGDLIFKTNDGSDGTSPTEAARIDSQSNFLIGHSDNINVASHEAGLQVVGQGTADYHGSTISIIGNANNANGAYLNFGKTRSNTAGSFTAAASGDVVGEINFSAADGTDLANRIGYIQAKVNDSVASNNTAGRFEFATSASGSGSPAVRIRIDDDGLKFGTDTAAANALNDYEEGTWTPTTGGTNPTVQNASYTKIGRTVHISLYLGALSNSTGNQIHGLPFTPSNLTYSPTRYHSNATNYHEYVLRSNSNSTSLAFLDKTDSSVAITTAVGSFLVASLTYQTDA